MGRIVAVYVAACTGSARLSNEIGLPIVHIGATFDVDAAIQELNVRKHGCYIPRSGPFRAFKFETGWNDWAVFSLDPSVGRLAGADFGVQVGGGRIYVLLPPRNTVAKFQAQLAGVLAHLRLQEATIRTDFLLARYEASVEIFVHPRYTAARRPSSASLDADLAKDLFVIDPAEHGERLFWLVVAALVATIFHNV